MTRAQPAWLLRWMTRGTICGTACLWHWEGKESMGLVSLRHLKGELGGPRGI